ncbi:flagellar hook-basal body complex protein FliE [Mangrovitalea sediminis]|uniref:flagellar hook-basal body complex protein FliE n=1 Tax=Mangrovitalea sediminis TaxID=1982043 RepID=UPI000BE5CA88|nr:flagellar hook-basal body complex protein FliE [Mangrovitalea sediminis]
MVERADINNVLSQIRTMRAEMMQKQRIQQDIQADRIGAGTQIGQIGKAQDAMPSFGQTLENAINTVNDLQQNSSQLSTAYEKGDPKVDITRVMIASQKASLSFQALTQVRNKVIEAYQDIMKMPM